MSSNKLRAVWELLLYVLVSVATCILVELILHRHDLGNGSMSAALWRILPTALAAAVGIWLGLTASRLTMARKKPKPPPC